MPYKPKLSDAEIDAAIKRAAENHTALMAKTGAPLLRYSKPGRSR